MSSSAPSPAPPPTCSTSAPSRLPPLTFWCHECDMSVSLLPSPSPFPCPHCRRFDSLLPLDSISPLSLTSYFPSQHSPDLPSPNPTPNSAPDDSIAAIPSVEIADTAAVCAICKDDLPRGSFARRLPCSHHYHSDCIVPWLSLRNSCPLCRSAIPCSRRPRTARFRIRVVEPDDVAEVDMGDSFHQIGFSRTQEGLEETGSVGPENSGETVSSEWSVGGAWGDGDEDELTGVIMSDVWEDLFA
ncbi:RING-H2 finger protein ATL65-like [Phalaenopsis equestris]|uniref:RING-H2 finger protein ATL65-like n=1 Tax=Phalaenopsis equestris TaxID=78828 RepID=UPI0009E2BFA3|nr:RING-H2 finger protein ATL65-like [Phalaenopsis equestris]